MSDDIIHKQAVETAQSTALPIWTVVHGLIFGSARRGKAE
jgi:hypothetical protein